MFKILSTMSTINIKGYSLNSLCDLLFNDPSLISKKFIYTYKHNLLT